MSSRLLVLALVAAALLAGCASTGAPRAAHAASASASAGRQLLLTVHQTESTAMGLTGTPSQRYLQRRYGPAPTVERTLSQLAREHRLRRVDGWPIQSLDVYCEVFAVGDDRKLEDVIAALAADPRVDLVQPMNLFDTQTTHYDDPYADLQSGAIQMEVEQAHRLATGRGVSIAIIDSAIDGSHPDLRGRVRLARNLVEHQPIAHGGEVHGTAIAGIIASAVNNREGIIGVAPDVSIAALRACWAVSEDSLAAQCSSFSLARALEVALSVKPNVINMSLAGPADPLLSRLLDEVIARGIIVVAAQAETNQRELARVSGFASEGVVRALLRRRSRRAVAVPDRRTRDRSAHDHARREVRVPHGQLARGREHGRGRRAADGARSEARRRPDRGAPDGHDDVFGGQRVDQRVPRARTPDGHVVLPARGGARSLLDSGSLGAQRVRHAEHVVIRVGVA
jgi:hypothetical protein